MKMDKKLIWDVLKFLVDSHTAQGKKHDLYIRIEDEQKLDKLENEQKEKRTIN